MVSSFTEFFIAFFALLTFLRMLLDVVSVDGSVMSFFGMFYSHILCTVVVVECFLVHNDSRSSLEFTA